MDAALQFLLTDDVGRKHMTINKLTLSLTMIFSLGLIAVAQQNSPGNATKSFYAFDRSHSQVFNRRNIDARKGWFSAALYKLFLYELRREAAYLKKNPNDKPYFGDGLPFQPIDETCKVGGRDTHRSVSVHQEFQQKSRGAATATFSFPKGCTDGDKVVYTIGLVLEHGRWVIDDVNYGEDTSLKQRLHRKDY